MVFKSLNVIVNDVSLYSFYSIDVENSNVDTCTCSETFSVSYVQLLCGNYLKPWSYSWTRVKNYTQVSIKKVEKGNVT